MATGAVAAFVKITVQKEHLPTFYELTLAFRDSLLAEPGVLAYDIAQSEKDPRVFWIYVRDRLGYRRVAIRLNTAQEAFQNWSVPKEILPRREYFKKYLEKVVPLWEYDREVQLCRLLHSSHLAPSEPVTPYPSPPGEGHLSLDDATPRLHSLHLSSKLNDDDE